MEWRYRHCLRELARLPGRTDAVLCCVSYLLALAQYSCWKDCLIGSQSAGTEGMRWQCWLVPLSPYTCVALSPVLTAIGIVWSGLLLYTCVSGKATLCLLGTGRNSGGVLLGVTPGRSRPVGQNRSEKLMGLCICTYCDLLWSLSVARTLQSTAIQKQGLKGLKHTYVWQSWTTCSVWMEGHWKVGFGSIYCVSAFCAGLGLTAP